MKKFDAVFVRSAAFQKEQNSVALLCEEVCSALSLFEWNECQENELEVFLKSTKPVVFFKLIDSMDYFLQEKKFSKTLSHQIKKSKPLPGIKGCCYICLKSVSTSHEFSALEENQIKFAGYFDKLLDYTLPSAVMLLSEAGYISLRLQLGCILSSLVQSMENLEELQTLGEKIENLETTVFQALKRPL